MGDRSNVGLVLFFECPEEVCSYPGICIVIGLMCISMVLELVKYAILVPNTDSAVNMVMVCELCFDNFTNKYRCTCKYL